MKSTTVLLVLFAFGKTLAQDNFIEYTFDKNIDEEVKSYLRKEIALDPASKFYLEITTGGERDGGNYFVFIGKYKDRPLDFIYDIISKSNRFYKCDNLKIPICFDYDFKFIGYGSGKRGVTRKAHTGNSYFIEFSTKGKVINKGK
jgi:hypothetical protein